LEEYRARLTRSTENWGTPYTGAVDLRQELLPDIFEAALAERFTRNAYAELRAFTYHVIAGHPLDARHGEAASQAIARLTGLQDSRPEGHRSRANNEGAGPRKTYLMISDAYQRTLALPIASRRDQEVAILQWLDDAFSESLLPQTQAVIRGAELSIQREMDQLDHLATGVTSLAVGMAAVVFLLAFGSPLLVSRRLVRPIEDLLDTLGSYRAGDKSARPTMRAKNEFGLLARSLGALLDELQETDRRVKSLACYDSTTGLPNREFFQERLAGALTRARFQGRAMGLLTMNLSGLKQLNETLGRNSGEELVRQVAARLQECVRLSDVVSRPSEDEWQTELSRLECDEFSILLTRVSQAPDTALVAQRVLGILAEPFVIDGRDIIVNASIGIGVYPQDGGDAETLMRNTSAAMSHALKRGGNDYQFYSEAMNTANSRKLQIQSRLSGAIDRNDFELHYQPVRESKHGQLTGAEALLRWKDPEMGPIGPDEFIPIAERAGLISQIGRWVLSQACAQARAWQDAGYPDLRMSVNVSAFEISDTGWVEGVTGVLKETGLSPGCLEFEITETTMIRDETKTFNALTRLTEMGVGIALDDFGTGYSSLSHLRRLPIRRIKIDRSFVSEISDQGEGAELAAAVISLAHSLKLEVVAEGVETEGQATFLRRHGCDELQGYLISRAVPPTEFVRFWDGKKPA
jgi:diguanylate cyclase (GGDEF)-like protein